MNQQTHEAWLRRRRGYRLHVIAAMAVLALSIIANVLTTPRYPWWLWLLMAWLPLIAAHTAWMMGLFDRWQERKSK